MSSRSGSTRHRVPRFLLLSLVLVLTGLAALEQTHAMGRAEGDAEAVRSVRRRLSPEEVTWRYAVAVVVAEDYTDADRPQLGSYLRILGDAVGDLPLRYLTEEERSAWAERVVRQERTRLVRRRDERGLVLDRRRLEGTDGARTADIPAQDPRAQDSQYQAILEEIRILDLLETDRVAVPATARLQKVEGEHRYRRVLHDPGATARSLNVEGLVYLTVEPVEDLVFLRVRSYNRLLERDREILRLVASPQEMPRYLEEASPVLVRELAGRELADLSVSVVGTDGMLVEGARIRLNGDLVGVGTTQERFLLPGIYRVEARTGDGRSVDRIVDLGGSEQRDIVLTLPPVSAEAVRLETEPPGARVYEGALWVGTTPVEFPRPAENREYTLSLRGYYDSRVRVGPDGPGRITRTLVATETDWYGAVTESRARFYRSFGAFAVSLSVPILINGMYQNLGGLFPGGVVRPDLSSEEQMAYLDRANLLLVGYYGGVGVSTALFGNMVWRLVQYIRTAQEHHDR